MAATVTMVKMKRQKKPFTANVHPDEVKNYQKGGWEIVKDKADLKQESVKTTKKAESTKDK